MRLEG